PPPPPPRAAAPSPRTIVERPAGAPAQSAQVRGALLDPRYGRLHALRAGRNTVGRDPDQDVQVEDGRVSGRHGFLFIKESGEASFMDVSTNGSVVNGVALHGEVAELAHGAVLRLGGASLILLLVPAQALREAGL
ncbi:FHA domain-containing protein, partial [Myxococcota bacterium]|nr:FHA domain-containing protein [Myxococcota bacterium]